MKMVFLKKTYTIQSYKNNKKPLQASLITRGNKSMKSEKRNHLRIKPKGLQAGLTINAQSQVITLDADILDISYSGIRVKLKQPIATDMTGNIRINMLLPESNTPFSVHGILKHQTPNSECGLHYVDHVDGSIDDLMFECVELDETTVLIKSL
jgi:hypothetical protein